MVDESAISATEQDLKGPTNSMSGLTSDDADDQARPPCACRSSTAWSVAGSTLPESIAWTPSPRTPRSWCCATNSEFLAGRRGALASPGRIEQELGATRPRDSKATLGRVPRHAQDDPFLAPGAREATLDLPAPTVRATSPCGRDRRADLPPPSGVRAPAILMSCSKPNAHCERWIGTVTTDPSADHGLLRGCTRVS